MGIGFTGQPFKLDVIDLSTDDSVASGGGVDDILLQPPAGKIYELCTFWVQIPDPAGSGAGTHKLSMWYDSSYVNQSTFCSIQSNTGSAIATAYMGYNGTTEYPSTASEQLEIMTGQGQLCCNNAHPITVRYVNSTDVNQTQTRIVKILVKIYDEVK